MDNSLLFPIISTLTSGIVSILVSVLIEYFGGLVGGIIACIPSIVVVDSIGIYFTLHAAADTEPDTVPDKFRLEYLGTPVGVAFNVVYLWLWSFVPGLLAKKLPGLAGKPRPFAFLAIVSALCLSVWVSFATIYIVTKSKIQEKYPLTTQENVVNAYITAGAFTIFGAIFGAAFSWRLPPSPRGNRKVRAWVILLRGVLTLIPRVVGYALKFVKKDPKSDLNKVTSLVFMFPMVLTTAMISLTLSSGGIVTRGAIGPLMLGMLSGSAYAIAISLPLSECGIWLSVLIGFVASVLGANVPSFFYLRWRRSQQTNNEVPVDAEKQ